MLLGRRGTRISNREHLEAAIGSLEYAGDVKSKRYTRLARELGSKQKTLESGQQIELSMTQNRRLRKAIRLTGKNIASIMDTRISDEFSRLTRGEASDDPRVRQLREEIPEEGTRVMYAVRSHIENDVLGFARRVSQLGKVLSDEVPTSEGVQPLDVTPHQQVTTPTH